jgi:hypothetical protein
MEVSVTTDEAGSEIWRVQWRLVKRTVKYGGKCGDW